MNSRKYDLKVFLDDPCEVEMGEFIAIFHQWIQTQQLDELLIDVADYSHVHHGPGIVLIGHDAHYGMDLAGGRMGLLYSRRRETHPTRRTIQETSERLVSVWHCALAACRRLETATALQGRLRFRVDDLVLRLNDGLVAATPEAYRRLKANLEPVLATLYPDGDVKVEPVSHAGSRLTVRIQAPYSPGVETLLKRLPDRNAGVGVGS